MRLRRRRDEIMVIVLMAAWVVAALAFGVWQHSVAAAVFMGCAVLLLRWNRGL